MNILPVWIRPAAVGAGMSAKDRYTLALLAASHLGPSSGVATLIAVPVCASTGSRVLKLMRRYVSASFLSLYNHTVGAASTTANARDFFSAAYSGARVICTAGTQPG